MESRRTSSGGLDLSIRITVATLHAIHVKVASFAFAALLLE
jgi:hypothetical protein